MSDEIMYCCDHSRQVSDMLIGSAPRVDVWLLLEYNAVWGKKAFPESTLSADVKSHLQSALDTIPDSRLVFIRQPERITEKVAFFIVDSRPDSPQIRAYDLDFYTDLKSLDIPSLVESNFETPFDTVSPEFLYLICTNGKRDLSCAKYGVPMYHAMTDHAGDSVWQSTHLGGHRFAATSAFLPHAIVYGHMEIELVGQLMDDYQQGILHPNQLRGRSAYELPVQAAEGHLLDHVSPRADAFRLVENTPINDMETKVVFVSNADDLRHEVLVRRELSEYEVLKSTADTAPVQVPIFRVVAHSERVS